MSADLPTLIDQLGEASMEARQLLADIRTATKDLRAAVKESADERERLAKAVEDAVAEDIRAEVTKQLEALGEETRKQMDRSVEKVGAEFDKLARLFLTGHEKGRPDKPGLNLRELAEAERERRVARGELL